MRTLLVTGFGAFPGIPENPSGAVARALDGTTQGTVRIIGREIETSWTRAWPALAAAVAETTPDALVMLGVSSRADLQVELTARNACLARADCDGEEPAALTLVTDGPAALPTTLPWQALDVATSEDAGGYLCNAVFYQAQLHFESIPTRGFVHLPKAGATDAHRFILRLADWMTAQENQVARPTGTSDETCCN